MNHPIFSAIQNKDISQVLEYIYSNQNLNVIDDFGNNLFHCVTESCFDDILPILLNFGVNISHQNDDGDLPLHIALSNGSNSSKLLKFFLDNTPNINIPNNFDNIPLHYARFIEDPFITLELIKKTNNINYTDFDNYSPLHSAILSQNYPTSLQLIQHGADIHALDHFNNTPLHLAIEKSSNHIICLLLDSGADIHKVNDLNYSCLELALNSKKSDIIQIFTSYQNYHNIKEALIDKKNQSHYNKLKL